MLEMILHIHTRAGVLLVSIAWLTDILFLQSLQLNLIKKNFINGIHALFEIITNLSTMDTNEIDIPIKIQI